MVDAVTAATTEDQKPAASDAGTQAAAAAPAAKGAADTVAAGGGKEPDVKATATWPDDWRVKLAGEDKDALKTLDRFADPGALYKSFTELRKKMNDGQKPQATKPPEGAEELKAWRAERGLPDEPVGYVDALKMPDGRVLGDADKPVAEAVAKVFHTHNADPALYQDMVKWYFDWNQSVVASQDEADATYHDEAIASLKEEWGGDYKRNTSAIATMFPSKDVMERLLGGRTADGRLIGDDPEMVKFLAGLALELNPAATIIGGGGEAGKNAEMRIADIKKMMADRNSDYWKGPKAPAIQEEYRNLLRVQERMQSRGKAA